MDEHGPYIDAHGDDTGLITRGGCIRLYAAGPEIHANTAHISTGLASVHIGAEGWLWLNHDSTYPVVAILCSPDETLTGRGVLAGASGGTNYSRVRFTLATADGPRPLDLNNPADYAEIAGNDSNLWYAVVQSRTRTQGLPSVVDRVWANHLALAARVGLLEQATPTPTVDAVAGIIAAVEAELVALEAGPVS